MAVDMNFGTLSLNGNGAKYYLDAQCIYLPYPKGDITQYAAKVHELVHFYQCLSTPFGLYQTIWHNLRIILIKTCLCSMPEWHYTQGIWLPINKWKEDFEGSQTPLSRLSKETAIIDAALSAFDPWFFFKELQGATDINGARFAPPLDSNGHRIVVPFDMVQINMGYKENPDMAGIKIFAKVPDDKLAIYKKYRDRVQATYWRSFPFKKYLTRDPKLEGQYTAPEFYVDNYTILEGQALFWEIGIRSKDFLPHSNEIFKDEILRLTESSTYARSFQIAEQYLHSDTFSKR